MDELPTGITPHVFGDQDDPLTEVDTPYMIESRESISEDFKFCFVDQI